MTVNRYREVFLCTTQPNLARVAGTTKASSHNPTKKLNQLATDSNAGGLFKCK